MEENNFKRSPSKVWWGNNTETEEWRDYSSVSPGSQDSGFSDTENHSPKTNNLVAKGHQFLQSTLAAKDIFKNRPSTCDLRNIATNYVEKSTPRKCGIINNESKRKCSTPPVATSLTRDVQNVRAVLSEPAAARKCRYTKNSPKISRSLFNIKPPSSHNNTDVEECHHNNNPPNQYASDIVTSSNNVHYYDSCPVEETIEENADDNDSFHHILTTKSLEICESNKKITKKNFSAPTIILETEITSSAHSDEGVTSFNTSLSSDDYESELECLFNGQLESPQHTSTPKVEGIARRMRQRRDRVIPFEVFSKFQEQQERVPPILSNHEIVTKAIDNNGAVDKWIQESRQSYETECMTTLQCKSIAAELHEKVSQLAACTTTILRGVLSHSQCIVMEYQNLNNSDQKYAEPLIQSLTCNIYDFLKTHTAYIQPETLKLYDDLRRSTSNIMYPETLAMVSQLFNSWQLVQNQILLKEVKKLVDRLEDPTSDMDVRATITGITSVSLRNTDLIELFIKCDIIPILLILCEKCEGSSLRCLFLRALSTMCCSASAIRHFEKFSGLELITETIEEASRPEPERSEAIALLTQITAPWLEDNHAIKGLPECTKKLVKSLTKFAENTRCCQNLLLATAALANLSSMDTKCIKYMTHYETARIILDATRKRGFLVSIYLLEQMATLLANMSSVESARKRLIDIEAPTVLLSFIKNRLLLGDDVEKRLQQKCMIALSRLCSDKNGAEKVVQSGGVEKLVKMCREKNERYNSDAVLVTALATLRKIADACGSEVINVQDVQELVQPKLLDSFLAYSSQNESYV